jgi:hypothetical protein
MKAGQDGVITVEEGKTLEVVDGMQRDRGYLLPYFVTDPDRMEVVPGDPWPSPRQESRWHRQSIPRLRTMGLAPGDFLHHLRTRVLEDDMASLGAEGHFHRVCELIDAA